MAELNKKISRFLFQLVDGICDVSLSEVTLKLLVAKLTSRHSKTYAVELHPDPKYLEVLRISTKRGMEVGFQVAGEGTIQSKGCQVELEFTMDGMLGFGTELIRQAIDAKQNGINKRLEINPLNSIATESYPYRGAYLTKDSCELIPLINDNLAFNYTDNNRGKLKQEEVVLALQRASEMRRRSVIEDYYLVSLYLNPKQLETFEVAGKNLVKVSAKLADGESMQGIVYFTFTCDEMLEFGEELIRKAISIKKQRADQNVDIKTLKFTSKTFNPDDMGLCLTSNSAALLIKVKDLGEVEELSDELKKEKFIWEVDKRHNYLSYVSSADIRIYAASITKKKFIKSLGGYRVFFQKNTWNLEYKSQQDLFNKLEQLRDEGFMFTGGQLGAVDSFCWIRDEGFVKGDVMCIEWEWRAPNRIIIYRV